MMAVIGNRAGPREVHTIDMDYCECGERASGRCVRKQDFVCRAHQMRFPGLISYLFDQVGRQPAGRREGLLCQSCYTETVDEALPELSRHLLDLERGSVERIVLRVVETGGWIDTRNPGMYPLGPPVITAVAGHRPAWLFDSSHSTMAALYATLAKSRSRTPPRLEVVRADEERTYTKWSGKTKIRRTVTPVGTLDAWIFEYHDDNLSGALLVGAHGGNADTGSTDWMPVGNTITLKRHTPGDFDTFKRSLQGKPVEGVYHDGPARYAMVTALRTLLA
jgi:hypothetical protein